MIVPLTEEHLTATIALHRQVLGDTLNASVGTWFLTKLYQQLLKYQPNSFCFVYLQDKQVLGFISGCSDYTTLNTQMMASLSLTDKLHLGVFFICHPWKITALLHQLRFGNYLKRILPQPNSYILTLGVAAHTQGQGIGRQLMNYVKNTLLTAHQPSLYLDTKTTNTQALRFYQKNGFTVIGEQYGNTLLRADLKI